MCVYIYISDVFNETIREKLFCGMFLSCPGHLLCDTNSKGKGRLKENEREGGCVSLRLN